MNLDDQFIVTWELVPGRGARETSQDKVLMLAEQAAKGNKVHAVSLTDNPGGNTGILPEAMGIEIGDLGMDSIIHVTCKDKNRSQLESQLYALERHRLDNLLIISGDYITDSIFGCAKPVFDIDSTHLLGLITRLNNGLEIPSPRGKKIIKPSNFFPGAAVSPFKATEAEQMMQYSKMIKKINNGARYFITQVGYDARKYHELLLILKNMNHEVPLIGNIFLLNYPIAKLMNQNKVPGCVVTDKLFAQIKEESSESDKGLRTRLERAAKLYAVLKGMGYKGVHLGGSHVTYDEIEYIIDRGEELSSNWLEYTSEFNYSQDNGYYVFGKDNSTGLNIDKKSASQAEAYKDLDLTYRVSRTFHKLFFIPKKNFFPSLQRLSPKISGSRIEKYFHGIEHFSKAILYDCQDCGDCALLDIAYVCPMGNCPKNQRNGPCEGSNYEWCEVYPGKKKCIWTIAYNRCKRYSEEKKLNSYQVSPYNWKFNRTSSWLNFYLGKDHSAERLGIATGKHEGER